MRPQIRRIIINYGFALVVSFVAMILIASLRKWGGPTLKRGSTLPFIASVIAAAWYGGFGAGLLGGAAALFAINRFFSPPEEMNLDLLDLMRALTFVTVSAAVSWLGQARRSAESELRAREQQQAAVARLGQQALTGGALDDLMQETVRLVSQTLGVAGSRVLEYRRPELIPDVRAMAQSPYLLDDKATRETKNEMQVQVRVGGDDWGRLTAEGRRRAFDDDDVHFLQAVSNVLSTALDHRRAERALRESEARTRAILNTAADGIITVDEAGTIESVNPSAEQMFGYTATDLLNRSADMLLAEPYRERYRGFVRLARRHALREHQHATYSEHREVEGPFGVSSARELSGRRKDGTNFLMDLTVSLVPLGERTLITGIVRDATQRKQLEREILAISDRERRRIGQDLHDGLGQHLAGISFLSSALRRKLAGKQLIEANDADKIDDLVNQAIIQARTLSRGLYPVELKRGLGAALLELASNIRQVFGMACQCECEMEVRAPEAVAAHLYRIAQEAVNNAIKHGHARQVIISLDRIEEAGNGMAKSLVLRIEDNGVGFHEPSDAHKGMGLRIMEYRSRMIGGTLRIQRGTAGGTVVSCAAPVE